MGEICSTRVRPADAPDMNKEEDPNARLDDDVRVFVEKHTGHVNADDDGMYVFEFDPEFKCHACKQAFRETDTDIIGYGSYSFHPEHYKCSVCQTDLAEEPKVKMFKNKMYCFQHYKEHNKPKAKCPRCRKVIISEDNSRHILGQTFHKNCLKCSGCSLSLVQLGVYHGGGARYTTGDPIYCKQCYLEKFQNACAGCMKVLTGTVCRAGNLIYHEMCFKCYHCRHPLQGKYFVNNHEVYCEHCHKEFFAERCHKCNELIVGKYKEVEDKHYCMACFTCAKCNKRLTAGKFHQHPNGVDLLCTPHFREYRAEEAVHNLRGMT